jgi:S1-C subfamily serine protease
LLPSEFINSVVALGSMQPGQEPTGPQPPRLEWRTVGTGFFYGRLAANDPDIAKRQYEVYLVTAAHVVRGHLKLVGDLHVRVNPKDPSSEGRGFELSTKEGYWAYHPVADIAVTRVNLNYLREQGFTPDFFTGDEQTANRARLKEIEVAAGDGIFVLGFPMNLAGVQRNHVIARQGIIARLSEMLDGASRSFMIDSFVFPGNSGGPVILKPELASIGKTKNQSKAYLLGVVTDYKAYVDRAVSPQTQRTRVTFEENSGLAEVLPTDFIEETIDVWLKLLKDKGTK